MGDERGEQPAAPYTASYSWGDARSRSIWRWQLILAATAVTITATIALLEPELFGRWRFSAGATAMLIITAVSLVVPWHRVGKTGVAVLPLADTVAIGLLATASDARLGLLWVFPIAWIATYYSMAWLIGALSVITAIMVTDALVAGLSPTLAERVLIVVLCMGFMGVTINVGSRRTRAYSHLLRRQFAQLDRTRRRAEVQAQRTAQLSGALETGLARVDRDGVLIDANAAFLRLFAADDIASYTPTTAVEYDDYRGNPVAWDATALARAASGDRFNDRRIWLYTSDSTWHALDVTTRPVEAASGEGGSNLVIVRDVTAAVEAERERETVATIVSHELRNPLTAILGHVDLLLEREDLTAGVRRPLAVIDNAAQRMQRLITSALDGYAGAASDDTATEVDLAQLVSASIQAFRPGAAAAQVSLTSRLKGARPVRGDAFRLRQAIDNLLSNALKYTPRGGSIRVTAAHTPEAVTLAFTDTGIGMSAAESARIFEPGYRGDAARTSAIGGVGLGMAIVHEIVVAHGGTVEVDSALGRGTTVTVRLPRAGAAAGPDAAADAHLSQPAGPDGVL